MQNGDLAEHHPDVIVVVLEGVLCLVSHETETSRFLHKERVTSTSLQWMDLPIKRLVTLANQYPDYEIQVITFEDEAMATRATVFLDTIGFPFPQVQYFPLDDFVTTLRYQPMIRGVYDSNEARLDAYGQVGVGVPFGQDWMSNG
jgi:hypothetical protein